MTITPVIMSGGEGSRLWPVSNSNTPKQFLALLGNKTMLQETVKRLRAPLFDSNIVLLADTAQTDLIRLQMPDENYLVIGEPCRRNTAAAAVAAAIYVTETSPNDDLLLLAPADHVIRKPDEFHKSIERAIDTAKEGHIVTFGITPESAETGYGYIKHSELITDGIFKVDSFKEKPDKHTAQVYCDSGDFNWNSGIFLFSARWFLKEIALFEPEILNAVRKAYALSTRTANLIELNKTEFTHSPSMSIDYAVMERTDRGAVIPCSLGWSDMGTYKSLYEIREKSQQPTNTLDACLMNAESCLVLSDGPQVSILGLNNIGVVVDKGRILVLDLDQSQYVKDISNLAKKCRAQIKDSASGS